MRQNNTHHQRMQWNKNIEYADLAHHMQTTDTHLPYTHQSNNPKCFKLPQDQSTSHQTASPPPIDNLLLRNISSNAPPTQQRPTQPVTFSNHQQQFTSASVAPGKNLAQSSSAYSFLNKHVQQQQQYMQQDYGLQTRQAKAVSSAALELHRHHPVLHSQVDGQMRIGRAAWQQHQQAEQQQQMSMRGQWHGQHALTSRARDPLSNGTIEMIDPSLHQASQKVNNSAPSRDSCTTTSAGNPASSSRRTPAFRLDSNSYQNQQTTQRSLNNGCGQTLTSPSLNLAASSSLEPQSATDAKACSGLRLSQFKNRQSANTLNQDINMTQAIALSNQTLGQEFKQAHTDVRSTLTQIKNLADTSHEGSTVTLSRDALTNLIAQMSTKLDSIHQIGSEWEQLCVSVNDSLVASLDKSSTLKKRLSRAHKEKTLSRSRQRSQRQKEMQKTKAVFERSLSEIKNTYERSQKNISAHYKQLEQMAQNMRDYRKEIGEKRRQNFQTLPPQSSSAHKDVNRLDDGTIEVSAVRVESGAENLTSEESKEDLEMKFLFNSSDMLQTFKKHQHPVWHKPGDQSNPRSARSPQHLASSESNPKSKPSTAAQAALVKQQSSALQQTNSFFSNNNNLRQSDEFEQTNKFTDSTPACPQTQIQSETRQRDSHSSGRPQNDNLSASKLSQSRAPARTRHISDHLQVINDSLQSEPMTEHSQLNIAPALTSPDPQREGALRSRNDPYLPQSKPPTQPAASGKNSLENSIAGISEIQAPAMMLQDGMAGGGWDSQLDIDQSVMHIDPVEKRNLQRQFVEQYSAIKDQNEKILFKQIFAVHHKVNTSMLQSQVQSNYASQTTSHGETVKHQYQSETNRHRRPNNHGVIARDNCLLDQSQDQQRFGRNEFRNSLAETAKRRVNKRSSAGCDAVDNDVELRDMLDVPDQFSLQSPLPPLEDSEAILGPGPSKGGPHFDRATTSAFPPMPDDTSANQGQHQLQDVQLNDILDAPSLEISLKTATELQDSQQSVDRHVYDSNSTDEMCRPPLDLNHLNTNLDLPPPNMPVRPPSQNPPATLTAQPTCQQQSGIQIVNNGLANLGTMVYSDGKSSTIISPLNEVTQQSGDQPLAITLKSEHTGIIDQVNHQDDFLNEGPFPDSEESSLLISEETMANKRTQNSCTKQKIISQISTPSKVQANQKQQISGSAGSASLRNGLVKQSSSSSRNKVHGIYTTSSSNQPQQQQTAPNLAPRASQSNTKPVVNSSHLLSYNTSQDARQKLNFNSNQDHSTTHDPDIPSTQLVSETTKPPLTKNPLTAPLNPSRTTLATSKQQAKPTRVTPQQVTLIKKAMIMRAQSHEPPSAPAAAPTIDQNKTNNTNTSSMTSLSVKEYGGQGAGTAQGPSGGLKVINKKINVVKSGAYQGVKPSVKSSAQASGAGEVKKPNKIKLSTSLVTRHRHNNSMSSFQDYSSAGDCQKLKVKLQPAGEQQQQSLQSKHRVIGKKTALKIVNQAKSFHTKNSARSLQECQSADQSSIIMKK